MTTELFWQIAIAIGGWVAMIATVRTKVSDHERRITNLEECEDKRPQDYVPRNEIAGRIDALQRSVDRLLDQVVYRRRNGEDA